MTKKAPLIKGKEREWGDFQTPPSLALQVCQLLRKLGISPRTVLEPTCGVGNFIIAALQTFPNVELIYGVEIQTEYVQQFELSLLNRQPAPTQIELHQDNIFLHQFPRHILNADNILIVGNPPWVTSSELGTLNAANLPTKSNLNALNGLDALTGKSNFDIGEFILLKLLEQFGGRCGTLAMLCKNSTIKNIIQRLPQRKFPISNIRAYTIDANREFGAAVEASLLVIDLGQISPAYVCRVAAIAEPDKVIRSFGWCESKFVSNLEEYQGTAEFDSKSPLVWRQGLKHDCVEIMELTYTEGKLYNGLNYNVNVENQWLYWLLKSSDLRKFEANAPRKQVIVTQQLLSDNTAQLKDRAPKLWQYLNKNITRFDKRKSSIYKGKPPFSIFGVGEYSFAPYKVAISGLYKQPYFSVIQPIDNRPVILDDTCYFLSFDNFLDALFTATILNSGLVKQFLSSITFKDAKRPYTKEILMRIDLEKVANTLTFQTLSQIWQANNYHAQLSITESDFSDYKLRLAKNQKPTAQFAQASFSF